MHVVCRYLYVASCRRSIDDSPYTTDIYVEEGAAGKTGISAIIVMDGIADAQVT